MPSVSSRWHTPDPPVQTQPAEDITQCPALLVFYVQCLVEQPGQAFRANALHVQTNSWISRFSHACANAQMAQLDVCLVQKRRRIQGLVATPPTTMLVRDLVELSVKKGDECVEGCCVAILESVGGSSGGGLGAIRHRFMSGGT